MVLITITTFGFGLSTHLALEAAEDFHKQLGDAIAIERQQQ